MGATVAHQEIRPQPGPQELFLSSPADIAIYGGAAGGGKTYALLMEPLRYSRNKKFGAVVFRREATQITNEGGLWDEAYNLYLPLGATPVQSPHYQMTFPGGARVAFHHLNQEKSVHSWQGAQIPLILFDELTHFSRAQFFYMLSRNRSTCGVRPYIRATTNPDADSWVAELIAWWIDQATGYPIYERAGVIRWFVRINDVIHWANDPQTLVDNHGVEHADCKSLTFVPSSVYDNKILLQADPGYLANLKALSRVERARLLDGNWKIKPAAGLYFARTDIEIIPTLPTDIVAWVRAWDLAASVPTEANPNPDYTAGVKIGRRKDGRIVVTDVRRDRKRAQDVRLLVQRTAQQDGKQTRIRLQQDPGQAGKEQAQNYVSMLAGYNAFYRRITGEKVSRAEPIAAQWQSGNVQIVQGPWNESFLAELEQFPEGRHDDQVDALSEAFAYLPSGSPAPMTTQVGAL